MPPDTDDIRHCKGFSHTRCEYFPCHPGVRRSFNCLFCYCPLVWLACPGPYRVFTDRNGQPRKDCTACKLPHDGFAASWRFIQRGLEKPVPWDGRVGGEDAGND